MTIKIQTLRTFVAVAECGGLAEAARRLHRTPSAVSMTLKALEEHLGKPLFEADRKTRLTQLGRMVLAAARRQVQNFDETVRDIERHASGAAGRVAVACVPSVAMRLLPEVLRRFRSLHPDVLVDVRDMESESVHEALRAGEVDIGIASPLAATSGVSTRLLARDVFGVVCHGSHGFATRGAPITLADIDPTEFIANGTCARIELPAMRQLLAESSLMVRNTTSILALVAASVGVTVLPRLAVDEHDPALRFVKLAAPAPERELVVLGPGGVTPSAALSVFTTLLEQVAGERIARIGGV